MESGILARDAVPYIHQMVNEKILPDKVSSIQPVMIEIQFANEIPIKLHWFLIQSEDLGHTD